MRGFRISSTISAIHQRAKADVFMSRTCLRCTITIFVCTEKVKIKEVPKEQPGGDVVKLGQERRRRCYNRLQNEGMKTGCINNRRGGTFTQVSSRPLSWSCPFPLNLPSRISAGSVSFPWRLSSAFLSLKSNRRNLVYVHQAVTQSAVMISAIYYPLLTRLISSNGIKNPQFWPTPVILHPSEHQRSCRFCFMVFSLVCLSHLFQYVFIMLLYGRADKDGQLPVILVFLLSTFLCIFIKSPSVGFYNVAGTKKFKISAGGASPEKFTVCVRVCSGYRGRLCVYRCFSGCWGRPGWDFHFGVDFNDQMSPTGKMLDLLYTQLLVWELIRRVESASTGRQAQSQKVRGQRHGA